MPHHTPRTVFFIALLLSFDVSGGSRTSFPEEMTDESTMMNGSEDPYATSVGALVDTTDDVTWNRHGHHHGHHNNVVVVNPGHGHHHHHGHHNNVVVVNPGRHNHGHNHHHHTNVVVVNPGRGHRHHHGPSAGAIFATAAAAMAAGAIIGAATRPPKPPRGTMVVVTPPAQPVYITNNGQRMIQVMVTAPIWCEPCRNEPIEVRMSGGAYFVASPAEIWAGQTFLAYLPAPAPPPVIVKPAPPPVIIKPAPPPVIVKPVPPPVVVVVPEPAPVMAAIISQGNPVWTLQVQVPPPKQPGQSFKVILPNGDVRPFQVPLNVFPGQFFQISYNPTQELLNKIASKNRCCCHDKEPICFWVDHSITAKKDGHCPRFEKTGHGFCARKKCKPFDKGCKTSHHTPAENGRKCAVTKDPHAYIREC